MKAVVSLAVAAFLALTLFGSGCVRTSPPQPPVSPAGEAPKSIPVSPSAPAPPQTGVAPPKILTSSAQPDFPARLDFSLKTQGSVNITDVRLHYAVDAESFASVTSEVVPDFSPSASVDVQWTWDMKKTGGLPPGAVIEYSWTIRDSAGNETRSLPATVSFDDERYAWQNLTENDVTIYWYAEDRTFAEDLMSVSQQALTRLNASTGAVLKRPVRMYIYASQQDLLGAMIFPQEWTGGAAYTDFGVIIIGIGPGNIAWGRTAIAHELTHLVIHQMTANPYNELPTWLDEGLAMYNQGPFEAGFADALNQAIGNNRLISVRSLSSPFSAYADQSFLSYAQSRNIVEYLVTTYGQGRMLELLETFSRGSGYDSALRQVYGFDMDGLNTLWQVDVNKRYQESRRQTVAKPAADMVPVEESPDLLAASAIPARAGGGS
jgi:hypothetical protein